jgi:hypothetical protein
MISRLALIGSVALVAEAMPRRLQGGGEYVDIGAVSLMVEQLTTSKAGYTTCVCSECSLPAAE